MELTRYLEIVRSRWPIALAGLLVTTLLTVFFVSRQPSTYESYATFVVRPRTLDSVEGVRAIDTLIRGVEINSTYANIARSDLIRDGARERIESQIDTRGIDTGSEVVTGTNILRISVTGPDPDAVYEMAIAVGDETVAYIDELQDVFELQLLDAPDVPDAPIAPNKPLTIGTGVLVGAGVGVLLAALVEAFLAPPGPEHRRRRSPVAVLGEADFRGRFQEELGLVLRADKSFSVGILKVSPPGPHDPDNPALFESEAVARRRMPNLPRDDAAAYLGDGTFAILLRDATAEEAEDVLRIWRAAIGSEFDKNGQGPPPHVAIGVWSAEPTRWIRNGAEAPKR